MSEVRREKLTVACVLKSGGDMNKRLGEILIERGYLSEQQVQHALDIQKKDDNEGMWRYIGHILVDMQIVTEEQVDEGFIRL